MIPNEIAQSIAFALMALSILLATTSWGRHKEAENK